MFLNKLLLQNFRNYSKTEFSFSDKVNLIIGSNAVGKTNILEAIYFLASGRSFRVKGTESEAIKYGEEIARIIAEVGPASPATRVDAGAKRGEGFGGVRGVESNEEKTTLEIVLTTGEVGGEKTGKKKYLLNGVGKRQFDFLGNLRAVFFGPENLELITDSPGLRRKYLDMVLFQVDHEYARSSLSYEKGLRQRNKLLEEMRETGVTDRRRLYFWDQLLIKNGNYITAKREEFIEYINSFGSVGDFGDFKIEYDRSTISEERLKQYDNQEIASGVTLVGPHRDDFTFRVEERESKRVEREKQGRDLSIYGSRGEQRLAILWLKLREMRFIQEKTEQLPILLLDDIFSELDVEHRKLVFDLTKNCQTIISTADMGMVEKEWLEGVKIIKLPS